MTPNDSIRHALSFLQTGLISMEPKTGFVRAWVGGINFDYFEDDQVKSKKTNRVNHKTLCLRNSS